MTRRNVWTWGLFAVCSALALTAVAYICAEVLRLSQQDAEARHRAAFEERVRLALWRMDAYLGSWLAAEQARAVGDYEAFQPAHRAFTNMLAEIQPGEVVIPSPLLTHTPEHVRLHAQLDADGSWRSPQVPHGEVRELAETHYLQADDIKAAETRLQRLAERVSHAAVEQRLGEGAGEVLERPSLARMPGSDLSASQMALNTNEFQARENLRQQQQAPSPHNEAAKHGLTEEGVRIRVEPLTPLWVNEELLLARRVADERGERLQVVWLDWPDVRAALKEQVADLLSAPRLVPLAPQAEDQTVEPLPDRALTTLPLSLDAEVPPFEAGSLFAAEASSRPLVTTLALVWAAVLLALVAAGVLLAGVLRLSERRALFVATVSHEMRTPLTTFRLYTDLLAATPREPQQQAPYLATLQSEAERLGDLLDNVLAASRLQQRRRVEPEAVSLAGLLERCAPRLRERSQRAGLELSLQREVREAPGAEADPAAVVVLAQADAVERILLNLVDNACKYAAPHATQAVLEVHVSVGTRRVKIAVRDYGPGVAEPAKLFRPFTAATKHASHGGSAGIGLGLALSRRLARELHGDLRYSKPTTGCGTQFTLELRRARPRQPV